MRNNISIQSLLDNLTVKEKVGQLLQLAPFFFVKDVEVEIFGDVKNLDLDKEKIFNTGSILGIGSGKDMIEVQKKYLKNSRHKIPLIFMADIIHGYKTIFPVPIAQASSFNLDIVEKCARISAIEAQTAGIHVTFSPMADISRDPRWGRVVEGFGEDTYLSSLMAEAMVKGYTGDGIEKVGSLASCVKHFAGYGASEAGRDYNTVDLSKTSLYSNYLKPYKAAIDAGARLIMTAFNTIDNIPCTVNTFLLRDVLRKQWNSNVVTISDYDSLNQIIAHGVAKDKREVAYKGLIAGLDIEMQSTAYVNHIEDLIYSKELDESLLDEAVYRILTLKRDLGLFDDPYKGALLDESSRVLTEENLELARIAAIESMVLLENDGILPFKGSEKIALIGPYARRRDVIGPWSWHGRRDLHLNLEDVLEENLILCSESKDLSEEEITKLKQADLIIFALGEPDYLSGEAHSRTNIDLPDNQDNYLELSYKYNKKSVTLLFNGRPLILNNIAKSNALLECWFLGSESSRAIKDILFGKSNPSGKLPMTFPRNVGQIPIYYNHLNTGRPLLYEGNPNMYVSKYIDCKNTPFYSFGYGLSYCNFKYSNLNLSKSIMKINETLKVSIDIINDSEYSGKEVVQLYLKDHYARISRPVKELIRFKKEFFNPHELKTIEFEITIEDLKYSLDNNEKVFDYGEFTIMVGTNSDDTCNSSFELVKD